MYGLDVTKLVSRDLHKALPAVLVSRMYLMRASEEIPEDVAEQAEFWRDWYNPNADDGMVSQFIADAGKLIVGEAQASTGGETLDPAGPGMVTDMQGNAFPANFTATEAITQTSALRLSRAFGRPLRITPIGGTQPDARSHKSQHHTGYAIDVYVEDYSDAEKTRLISTALAMGYNAIGGYARGDGKGTIHLDIRGGGLGAAHIAKWWRVTPGVDGKWFYGPKWFTEGILQGLAMRGRASG